MGNKASVIKMNNKYLVVLKALIAIKHKLNIVVVGANDGKTNDPIYDFVIKNSNVTNILLIEPNKLLLPYLQNNYSTHPSCQISNCAIGKEGTLTLYVIKQEYWNSYQPPYAKEWPSYRAPTGITSALKSHIEKHLVRVNLDPDEMIDMLNVPSKALKTLLEEIKWPTPIDILQIDAEGYDDEVIYNSNLAYTRPKLIFLESQHIPSKKYEALKKHLSKQRYRVYKVDRDSLAICSYFNLTCIFLNLVVVVSKVIGIKLISRIKRKLANVMKNFINKQEKEKA